MMMLRLRQRTSPITGQPFFTLWREIDGRTEATGFESIDEAVSWAHEQGHNVETGSFA